MSTSQSRQIRKGLFCILALPLLSGCPSYTLQKGRVYGTMQNMPVRLSADKEKEDLELIPHIAMATEASLVGVSTEPNQSQDTDVIWRQPRVRLGATLESTLVSHLIGSFGLSYANSSGKNLLGGHVGLGAYLDFGSLGFRFDGNLFARHTHYDMEILRVEDEDRRVIMDDGSGLALDGSVSATVNTTVSEWPLNAFFMYETGTNSFYEFVDPQDGTDLSFDANFTQYSLGLYRNLNSRMRLLAGVRLSNDFNISRADLDIPSSNELFLQLNWKITPGRKTREVEDRPETPRDTPR